MHDTRTNTFIPDTMHYPFKKKKKNICSLNVLPIICLLKILQMMCLRTEESSYLQNLFLFITFFHVDFNNDFGVISVHCSQLLFNSDVALKTLSMTHY